MDRLLYTSMSGAKQNELARTTTSNNLANVSTTGFKADLEQFRAMPVFGPGYPSRVYAMSERPATDLHSGFMQTTGRELDMAIQGDGWFAVQGPDGREGYTRAGDLRLTETGMLVNGAGDVMLGDGGPIIVPPYEKIDIGGDGTITIQPLGQGPSTLAVVGRIRMVNPPADQLKKDTDGLMRLKDGTPAVPDGRVRMLSGTLEASNVNAVGAMVRLMELSRHFELQVKMMKTAEEVDQSSSQLLKM